MSIAVGVFVLVMAWLVGVACCRACRDRDFIWFCGWGVVSAWLAARGVGILAGVWL